MTGLASNAGRAAEPSRIGTEQQRLAEPLRSRTSPSVFDPTHEVSPGEVELLLEAVRWAPTCGNGQPARLLLAPRGTPAHSKVVARLSRGNSGWVPRASLVLIGGTAFAPDEDGQGGRQPAYADFDLGQAIAHLSLQATAMGLVSHQFAGFDHDGLAGDLGVPAWVRLMVGVAVGVQGDPGEVAESDAERDRRPRTRRSLDDLAHGSAWGRPWREAWSD